jgi:hypothetical protein
MSKQECSGQSDSSRFDDRKSSRKIVQDVGAEEFSETLYDSNAPTLPEFDADHSISSTGAELPRTKSTQQK